MKPRTLPQLFLQDAPAQTKTAALTLLRAGQPDLALNRADLISGASDFTRAYHRAGLHPGDVIILIFQHSLDLTLAYWGAILYGLVPSIMPYLTEKLLPDRYRADLAALVAVTRPQAVITYPEFESEVLAALPEGGSVRVVLHSGQVERGGGPASDLFFGLQRQPEDIVLLQHSSGTTGLQKGVALSHQAVLNQLEAYTRALRLNKEDVIVSWLPLYHDMGLIAGYLMPLLTATPLVLLSPFEWVRAPYRLMQAVSKFRGTLTWLPNFAYRFCASKIRDRDLEGVDLSSWRAVINCSEPVRADSHAIFAERFAPYGFNPRALCASYAMAENVFAVTQGGLDAPLTLDEIDRDAFQVERVARPAVPGRPTLIMVSNGRPIEGTEVKVVDNEGRTLAERQVGEIALRSNCMLSEYYHRPDETAKAFRDGWYLTGDLGYLANGELFVSGRKKDIIIVGGKNIHPQDLELLAMEAEGVHPGRVSAFGIYNEDLGTEEVVIAAEVDVPEGPRREEIARQVAAHIARGSAVSVREVYLVSPPWLIKTSSGKTARLANREKYLKEKGLL